MAGMGSYLNVLAALAALPGGGRAPVLPTVTPGTVVPIAPTSAPLGPAPTFAPMPSVPPPAPMPAINPAIVPSYQALAGPAPVAPVISPASKLDKLAAILGGISAGLQGRGGEYVQGLREQREKPIREYEAKKERYDARRSELGVMGRQAAMEQSERRRRETQDRADRNFEIELNERARQLGFRDQVEIETLRDAMLAKRQREEREAEERRQQAVFENQQKISARNFARDYRRAGAKGTIALELAEYDAGLRDSLTPAAARWESSQAKLAEARAARQARIGSGSGAGQNAKAAKAFADFNAAKAAVQSAIQRGAYDAEQMHRRTLDRAFANLSRFPGMFETGFDDATKMPTAKVRAQQQQQAPALNDQQRGIFGDIKRERPQATDEQIYDYMRKKGWL